jgi:hypothetical protein
MKSERIGNSKKIKALGIALAVFFTATLVQAQNRATESSEEMMLFVQNARSISYDSRSTMLTLEGISPVVIFFSDRPNRVAGHILLPSFIDLWDEGDDSFAQDPPNASISIFDGTTIYSAIVELADPQVRGDQISYRVLQVLDGELPATGGACSLFIDGALRGGLRGAAGGAIIGGIAGDAGKGAAIGAAVGVVGGAVRQNRQAQSDAAAAAAAADAASKTRVVNVSNANGSMTPVTLHLVDGGWKGPRGEIYPTLPTPDQLSGSYGMK